MSLSKEIKNIWNTNAAFWDERMGEGNTFHETLLEQNQLDLLEITPNKLILDLACGNGHFSRSLAQHGAKVVAIDISDQLIEIAQSKSQAFNIDYRTIDATKLEETQALLKDYPQFEAIVCTMAIQDIDQLEPLIQFAYQALPAKGTFTFSIPHPCFSMDNTRFIHEVEEIDGEVLDRYAIQIRDYLVYRQYKGLGIQGQPELHYYFHRPIGELLQLFFNEGFLLDRLLEPCFPPSEGIPKLHRKVYQNNPPVMIARMRKNDGR